MADLSSKAASLQSKYIQKASESMVVDKRKRRGLQAEINKLDSVRMAVVNNRIDRAELVRFRGEVSRLLAVVDMHIADAEV